MMTDDSEKRTDKRARKQQTAFLFYETSLYPGGHSGLDPESRIFLDTGSKFIPHLMRDFAPAGMAGGDVSCLIKSRSENQTEGLV